MNKLRWHIWQTDDAISVIHLTTYFADFADLTVKCPPCESYYRWALLCWCPCQLLSCPLIFSSWRIWHSHRSPWLLVILSLHPGCRAVAVNKFWILSDYVGSFFCSLPGTMWPRGLILDVPWMQLLLVNGCLVCVRESLTIRTQGEKRWILSQCHSLEIIGNSTPLNGNWRPTALSQKLVAWEALFVLPPRHALFGYSLWIHLWRQLLTCESQPTKSCPQLDSPYRTQWRAYLSIRTTIYPTGTSIFRCSLSLLL